jgi:hypothetical protein
MIEYLPNSTNLGIKGLLTVGKLAPMAPMAPVKGLASLWLFDVGRFKVLVLFGCSSNMTN